MKKLFVLLLSCIMLVSGIALADAATWVCPACGATCDGNFCKNDATPRPSDAWVCPNCGKTNDGAFCENDATPRPGASSAAAKPSGMPETGIFSADGRDYLGPEAKEVKLTFNKGKPVTAYAVRILDYVDSLSSCIHLSPDKVKFGGTLGKYQQFIISITDCYGIAVDIYVSDKDPEYLAFKVGLMNERKGDYCEYHDEVVIRLDETGTVKCYNKEPKTFDGYKIMGCQANRYSFTYEDSNVILYFASREAAEQFVRLMIECIA